MSSSLLAFKQPEAKMQKNTEPTKETKLDWDKIQKNLEKTKQGEQLAWMDTEGEDAGVERQKTSEKDETPDHK
jgi:hypothetical protein